MVAAIRQYRAGGANRDYEALVARLVGFVETSAWGFRSMCAARRSSAASGAAGNSGRCANLLFRDRAAYRLADIGAGGSVDLRLW
ncbi:MAG TPA: hypothetical protein VGN93_22695 [Shinella sp.]|jgi:hypothetical protein|nr:hypothetical protein [Shinella sp.]